MSKKSVPKISFDLTQSKTEKKYVIFAIKDLKFGVPVEQISQITEFDKVFSLPNTPDYVLGVINLRGRIISLVHLGNRLGLTDSTEADDKHSN